MPLSLKILLISIAVALVSSCTNIGQYKGYSGKRLDISKVATIRGVNIDVVVASYIFAKEFDKEIQKEEPDLNKKAVRGFVSELELLPDEYIIFVNCVTNRVVDYFNYGPVLGSGFMFIHHYTTPAIRLTVEAGTFYVLGCEKLEDEKYKVVLRSTVKI